MAALKTQKNKASVKEFLQSVPDEKKRKDCETLLKIMKEATGEKAFMWGDSIVGFGDYHYKSERSRQEGDWFIAGFSPRKTSLTLYLMAGISNYKVLVGQLGKCKISGSCLHINRLADVDPKVLKELIVTAFHDFKERVKNKA
ncbi:MAG: DUF1801 domain-containing protein [Chitinophagaceae bacterium]|nr:DUF1801 domain-containing protein [Chitinophagaceae bacterium]